MASLADLSQAVENLLGNKIQQADKSRGELTIQVKASQVVEVCSALRDEESTRVEQLIDLCGVDYLAYGKEDPPRAWKGRRYAVVYHLLSVAHNHRIRVKTFLDDEMPKIASIVEIWPCADWFEREAFDLFGIVFEGHPDLRRILTDYGFIGHPFRKDFPLSGYVEMRYDIEKGRVVYEPVSIEPRTLVPRVIREDSFGHRDT